MLADQAEYHPHVPLHQCPRHGRVLPQLHGHLAQHMPITHPTLLQPHRGIIPDAISPSYARPYPVTEYLDPFPVLDVAGRPSTCLPAEESSQPVGSGPTTGAGVGR
jgi:hypothetical protein